MELKFWFSSIECVNAIVIQSLFCFGQFSLELKPIFAAVRLHLVIRLLA